MDYQAPPKEGLVDEPEARSQTVEPSAGPTALRIKPTRMVLKKESANCTSQPEEVRGIEPVTLKLAPELESSVHFLVIGAILRQADYARKSPRPFKLRCFNFHPAPSPTRVCQLYYGAKVRLGAFFLLRLDFGLELRLKLRLDFSLQLGFGLLGSFSRQSGSRLSAASFSAFASSRALRFSAFLNSRSLRL